MLYFRRTVKAEDLPEVLKDLTYSHIEIKPRKYKNSRDFKLKCCLPVTNGEVCSLKGSLKLYSHNPILPEEVRQRIQSFAGHYSSTMWISVDDYRELKQIEKQNKIHFGIPKQYEIYLDQSNDLRNSENAATDNATECQLHTGEQSQE